jgi:hypothetical protein
MPAQQESRKAGSWFPVNGDDLLSGAGVALLPASPYVLGKAVQPGVAAKHKPLTLFIKHCTACHMCQAVRHKSCQSASSANICLLWQVSSLLLTLTQNPAGAGVGCVLQPVHISPLVLWQAPLATPARINQGQKLSKSVSAVLATAAEGPHVDCLNSTRLVGWVRYSCVRSTASGQVRLSLFIIFHCH